MMGHTHALTGLAAGAATIPIAPVHTLRDQLAWTACWAGMAMLPDLDQGSITITHGRPRINGSTAARLWGPITAITARVIGTIARGHRQGTHDIVIAPTIFAVIAVIAARHHWSALIVLALAIGLAAHAVHFLIPGEAERTWPLNLGLSLIAAHYLLETSQEPTWLPYAVAGGVIVHIGGDALTTGKVPVPGTWMFGTPHRWGVPIASTNSWLEPVTVAVCAITATGLLIRNTGCGPLAVALLTAVTT